MKREDNLEKGIQKVDRGTDWGNFEGSMAKRLFEPSLDAHLFCKHVKKDFNERSSLKIADLGGATGAVSRKILEEIGNGYDSIGIDVLDIDHSKFPHEDDFRIKYVRCNAQNGLPGKYDLVLSRFLLHYNTLENQGIICRNIADSIAPNGSAYIIDAVATSTSEKDRLNNIMGFLSKITGCNSKSFLTDSGMIILAGMNGLEIRDLEPSESYRLNLDNFFKGRYNLNDKESKEVAEYLGPEGVEVRTMRMYLRGGRSK